MNGDDVCEPAVEGARDVKRLAMDLGHEQRLGVRSGFKILLNNIAKDDDPFDVLICHLACSHALLCMLGDDVVVVGNCLAKSACIECCGHVAIVADGPRNRSGRGNHPEAGQFPRPEGASRRRIRRPLCRKVFHALRARIGSFRRTETTLDTPGSSMVTP